MLIPLNKTKHSWPQCIHTRINDRNEELVIRTRRLVFILLLPCCTWSIIL